MCTDCGCDTLNSSFFPKMPKKENIILNVPILKKNDDLAHENWHWFQNHHILTVNLMSSPGSGKTTLLEATIKQLKDTFVLSTLVGDQQTDNDAIRIQNAGGKAQQITTHSSCHLDAQMIKKELGSFVTGDEDILFIENVGNLVCPSAFALGEHLKVALLSVTEGEDKPEKYPVLFHKADLILITKSDLTPYLDWDEDKCMASIKKVNPIAKIIKISTKSGEGIKEWFEFLKEKKCV